VGGFGSGRWAGHEKAETVEDALVLDAADLTRKGLLQRGPTFTSSSLRWTITSSGEERASVGVVVETRDMKDPWVRLNYTSNGTPMLYRVPLVSSRPPMGGLRWWWKCPAQGCGRKVLKLYLPPSSEIFACRKCHRLTYTSAQEHDSRVDALVRGGLENLVRMPVEGTPLKTILLSLKAEARIVDRMRRRSSK